MVHSEVYDFIKNARAQGRGRDEISADLASGGWTKADIAEAYLYVENNPPPPPVPPHTVQAINSSSPASICSYCHKPILPTFFYCPNCGNKLSSPPLSTTPGTQAWIYAFSIVLPIICFLAISKWQGPKYYKSEDPKAKLIGTIAWGLLICSTVVTLWYAYQWTQEAIQSTESAINTSI